MQAFILCALALLITACGSSHSDPAMPRVLDSTLVSTGSPAGDEDPSVIRASNGTLHMAWFSKRTGNGDIYIATSPDGKAWSAAERVTSLDYGDFYPNLMQDAAGNMHLTWFQWVQPELGQIRYKRLAAGATGWLAQPEEAATTILGSDDWLPTIAQAADGSLLIYFVSAKRRTFSATYDLYVARKRPGEAAWDAAVPVAGLNAADMHDMFPYAARVGGEIVLVWVRYDLTNIDFRANHRSDLYLARSADGLAFSAPQRITTDGGDMVNLFPQLYQRHDGSWWILWLSTREGAPAVYEIPLANAAAFPGGLMRNDELPSGYSHRVAPTSTPGRYVGAWVEGALNAEDIYARTFDR